MDNLDVMGDIARTLIEYDELSAGDWIEASVVFVFSDLGRVN
jgi:hypothetical protein